MRRLLIPAALLFGGFALAACTNQGNSAPAPQGWTTAPAPGAPAPAPSPAAPAAGPASSCGGSVG
jgi:hypothetical protein